MTGDDDESASAAAAAAASRARQFNPFGGGGGGGGHQEEHLEDLINLLFGGGGVRRGFARAGTPPFRQGEPQQRFRSQQRTSPYANMSRAEQEAVRRAQDDARRKHEQSGAIRFFLFQALPLLLYTHTHTTQMRFIFAHTYC